MSLPLKFFNTPKLQNEWSRVRGLKVLQYTAGKQMAANSGICVAYITTRNGKRIYARSYGFKCFPIKKHQRKTTHKE